jgi:hypothetical protein
MTIALLAAMLSGSEPTCPIGESPLGAHLEISVEGAASSWNSLRKVRWMFESYVKQ